jgi:antitoxin MazE
VRVELAKWGNSAAVRVPAGLLADAGFQVGQALNLRAEGNRLVLEPAADSLEDMVARITPENRHVLAFDGPAVGAKAW